MASFTEQTGIFVRSLEINNEFINMCLKSLLNACGEASVQCIIPDNDYGGLRFYYCNSAIAAAMLKVKSVMVSKKRYFIYPLETNLTIHSVTPGLTNNLLDDIKTVMQRRFGPVLKIFELPVSKEFPNIGNGNWRVVLNVPEDESLPIFKKNGTSDRMAVKLPGINKLLNVTFFCSVCEMDGHSRQKCITEAFSENTDCNKTEDHNLKTSDHSEVTIKSEQRKSTASNVARPSSSQTREIQCANIPDFSHFAGSPRNGAEKADKHNSSFTAGYTPSVKRIKTEAEHFHIREKRQPLQKESNKHSLFSHGNPEISEHPTSNRHVKMEVKNSEIYHDLVDSDNLQMTCKINAVTNESDLKRKQSSNPSEDLLSAHRHDDFNKFHQFDSPNRTASANMKNSTEARNSELTDQTVEENILPETRGVSTSSDLSEQTILNCDIGNELNRRNSKRRKKQNTREKESKTTRRSEGDRKSPNADMNEIRPHKDSKHSAGFYIHDNVNKSQKVEISAPASPANKIYGEKYNIHYDLNLSENSFDIKLENESKKKRVSFRGDSLKSAEENKTRVKTYAEGKSYDSKSKTLPLLTGCQLLETGEDTCLNSLPMASNSNNNDAHVEINTPLLAYLNSSSALRATMDGKSTSNLRRNDLLEDSNTASIPASSETNESTEFDSCSSSHAQKSQKKNKANVKYGCTKGMRKYEVNIPPLAEQCIREVTGVLDFKDIQAFMHHVKKKSNPSEISEQYTNDTDGLKNQLKRIINVYYHKPLKGTSEDIRFMKWLKGLIERFDKTASRKRKRTSTFQEPDRNSD